MSPCRSSLPRPSPDRALALLFCCCLIGASPGPARAPSSGPPAAAVVTAGAKSWNVSSWKAQVARFIGRVMGNQRGMVQVATLGMLLALFIIWWRK